MKLFFQTLLINFFFIGLARAEALKDPMESGFMNGLGFMIVIIGLLLAIIISVLPGGRKKPVCPDCGAEGKSGYLSKSKPEPKGFVKPYHCPSCKVGINYSG